MMMEGKAIKEELPDKEYQHSGDTARRSKTSNGKERRTPEPEETRPASAGGPGNGAPSPPNNGSADSLSPPLGEGPTVGPRATPALHKLRRFLSTLLQFASDVGLDTGDRVRTLIHNLVSGAVSIEEFQGSVQESTNYPLRASVPGFLRALLPHAQRDLLALARHAKQTPLQYIRTHEHLIIEACGGEAADIFAPGQPAESRRRASDPFYESALHTNGAHAAEPTDYAPPAKRALLINPSPFLYPLPNSHLFDYSHPYQGFHGAQTEMLTSFERSRDGIAVRDVGALNSSFPEPRMPLTSTVGGSAGALGAKSDDEWKNINTMLNCILSMVEKTKRALAILQQRGSSSEPAENGDVKRMCSEIMSATVRQTEERVAEVRRRAEDAVNQVKRQALAELQRAAGAAEARAAELVSAERGRMERLLAEARKSPPAASAARDLSPTPPQSAPALPAPAQQNSCWNCGRKAQETCSGCNAARYCGAFCQHKDWENHHQVCCGRDLKPTTALTTSPPVTQPGKPLPRATTPINSAPDRHAITDRIPLNADRHPLTADRHTLTADRHPLTADRHPLTADRHPLTADRHPLTADRHPERLPQSENRLSLTTLNNAERMLASNTDRPLNTATSTNDRLALATLSTAQGLIGGIGGKK